ncbi:hypothetical protein MWH25_10325 [Natroniella acetigena]|uniref:hypothetical protein n=1 Tax=Natroniella acetigena TaxID=52004 RepID=UPI002009EFF7|nr:hypothetical protein [Natroniella acetigena]MCK8828126.1 hypothetical protein [Natroniella acetigena]
MKKIVVIIVISSVLLSFNFKVNAQNEVPNQVPIYISMARDNDSTQELLEYYIFEKFENSPFFTVANNREIYPIYEIVLNSRTHNNFIVISSNNLIYNNYISSEDRIIPEFIDNWLYRYLPNQMERLAETIVANTYSKINDHIEYLKSKQEEQQEKPADEDLDEILEEFFKDMEAS